MKKYSLVIVSTLSLPLIASKNEQGVRQNTRQEAILQVVPALPTELGTIIHEFTEPATHFFCRIIHKAKWPVETLNLFESHRPHWALKSSNNPHEACTLYPATTPKTFFSSPRNYARGLIKLHNNQQLVELNLKTPDTLQEPLWYEYPIASATETVLKMGITPIQEDTSRYFGALMKTMSGELFLKTYVIIAADAHKRAQIIKNHKLSHTATCQQPCPHMNEYLACPVTAEEAHNIDSFHASPTGVLYAYPTNSSQSSTHELKCVPNQAFVKKWLIENQKLSRPDSLQMLTATLIAGATYPSGS